MEGEILGYFRKQAPAVVEIRDPYPEVREVIHIQGSKTMGEGVQMAKSSVSAVWLLELQEGVPS